jgi:alkanesulfonate monooxygenase SsuD/methylene tetrahydromethanopterin reductase-like flavin-dependent oxidoreductase (luciferase family)
MQLSRVNRILMRFVLIQEADGPGGTAPGVARYDEMLEEAAFAEEMGFSAYACSEQHFNPSLATVSAPDILLAAVAMRTSTIKLRVASFVLLSFNHPLRVAERIATLDLLTKGRFEVGTARSNNPGTLRAFGVDPEETRGMWRESIEIIRGALAEEPFSFEGRFWQVDNIRVIPRPITKPHPPIHVSATSIETHLQAGKLGIGVMTGNSLPGGWDYLTDALCTYREGQEDADSASGAITDCRGVLAAVAHCAETEAQAHGAASAVADHFVTMVAGWYDRLSTSAGSYSEMAGLKEVVNQKHDLAALIDRSPFLSIGTPEFFVDRAQRLQAMGYDEFILRIDGMTHEDHMKAIELIGTRVIPALR